MKSESESSEESPGANPALGQDTVMQLVVLLVFGLVLFVPFALIQGIDTLGQTMWDSLWWIIPLSLVAMLFHEYLHALGFRLASNVPPNAVEIHTDWRKLDIRTTCHAPISVGRYRFAALLPMLVLGLVPAVASVAIGHGGIAFFAWLGLGGAAHDLLFVWFTRVLDRHEIIEIRTLGDRLIEEYRRRQQTRVTDD